MYFNELIARFIYAFIDGIFSIKVKSDGNSAFTKNPALVFLLLTLLQYKFILPALISAVVVMNQHSPMFLTSNPFLDFWKGNPALPALLLTFEMVVLITLAIHCFVGIIILLVPLCVALLCLRSFRY